MRTKTLLLTAAIGAASVAASMAQTVYSVNAVGFINVTVPANQFAIIANQLNNGSNTVEQVFAGAPAGITLYKFNGVGYDINGLDEFGWADPTQTFAPGEAAFIKNPASTNITITLVGEVPQGSLVNPIPAGFSMRSSQVPQAGLLQTTLGFPAVAGDTIYRFNVGTTPGYSIYSLDEFGWSEEPNVNVGEGFFVKKAAATSWNRTFSVNN